MEEKKLALGDKTGDRAAALEADRHFPSLLSGWGSRGARTGAHERVSGLLEGCHMRNMLHSCFVKPTYRL